MLPSQASEGPSGDASEGDLEERLRSLILNNATSSLPLNTSVPANTEPSLAPNPSAVASEDRQAELDRSAANSGEPLHDPPWRQQQNTGRKKPNQAQRRQMNSQLSIPIDTRPQHNAQPPRGYGNAQQSWFSHGNRNLGQHQHQRFTQDSPNPQQPSPYNLNGIYQHGPQSSPRARYQPSNERFQTRQGQQYPRQHYQLGNSYHSKEYDRPQPRNQTLYRGGATGQGHIGAFMPHGTNDISSQSSFLDNLCSEVVPKVGIDSNEEAEKESFRVVVEQACRDAITEYEHHELSNANFDPLSVELKCFGSMSSGFATKASDMDLALLIPHSQPAPDTPRSCIPRVLEKKLLDAGYGARLLTRTRVPIIKLCEKPTKKLRADLIEERTKWDDTFTGEKEVGADTSQATILPDDIELDGINPVRRPMPSPAEPVSQMKVGIREDHFDLPLLKQKETQSLVDYYNNAKRVLRNMEGSDLTVSSPRHDVLQSRTLNSVCKAFISGLSSEPLSLQLRHYKSISPLFDDLSTTVQRSLSSIWTQVEGERLAMAYESRTLTEADEEREAQCSGVVKAWRRLQDDFEPSDDAIVYGRKLNLAHERLKNMNSLALVLLEETPHEQVSYYATRARRLLDDLGRSAMVDANTIICDHYISGIQNTQIREDLRKWTSDTPKFGDVVIQHKALQLIVDFEHAKKMDLYSASDRPYIDQYISFLRNRGAGPEAQTVNKDLLAAVRKLPDPTKVSQHGPRDRYRDHLEFPKTGIGIQCDINFSAELALHNTLLLRCYSHSDSRVRILILFVKHWAKLRAINTPYRGTLSSYGYVLMVLHYLVNIAFPFVCPNLQDLHKDPPSYLPPAEIEAQMTCKGRNVYFWRNEVEIKDLANRGLLNQNKDSVGFLLRGFFEYFAQSTQMTTVQGRGFDWGREVLSLRTLGGILSKREKGWTGAKTTFETSTIAAPPIHSAPTTNVDSPEHPNVVVDGDEVEFTTHKSVPKTLEETKEIRHRYLFAIEDPFELDHNVARTVNHNGIVSIRDEFRRAWRIIKAIGKNYANEGLLDPISMDCKTSSNFTELLNSIHGDDTMARIGSAEIG